MSAKRSDRKQLSRSRNICFAALVMLTIGGGLRWGNAEHADIDLRVIAPSDEKEAFSDQEPPAGGVQARPLLKVRAGDPLVLQFILTNIYPHKDLKDVTVRYFVAREGNIGQRTPPDMTAGVVTEGRFVMNFKPKCRVGARMQFVLTEPGIYIARVETHNTQSDHEHFSAIDLQVE